MAAAKPTNAETIVTRDKTASDHDGFLRFPLSFFKSSMAPELHIYGTLSPSSPPSMIAGPGLLHADWQIEELRRAGYSFLYVSQDEFETVSLRMIDRLESLLQDSASPAEERFLTLQSVGTRDVGRAFRSANTDKALSMSKDFGALIVDLVTNSDVSPWELYDLAQHDTTTFIHASNVAAYAVVLAEKIGIKDKQELREISTGALLHDIGKRTVPRSILNKPSALNADERVVIERHPQLGYEELYDREGVSFGELMMVYQHHERLDGGGYPVGVSAEEIHPWAKLLSVVDVFDAMTADRPYRPGMNYLEVLAILQEGAGTQFDRDLVKCWISLFQR